MPKNILIAEDEFDIRFMLEQLLTLEGFSVRTVPDGKQALSALDEMACDLLILDITMPELDGFGVLRAIDPAKLAGMQISILSAKTPDEDIIRGYSVGAAYYVTKPFDNDFIVDIVKYLIGDLTAQERAQLQKRIEAR